MGILTLTATQARCNLIHKHSFTVMCCEKYVLCKRDRFSHFGLIPESLVFYDCHKHVGSTNQSGKG